MKKHSISLNGNIEYWRCYLCPKYSYTKISLKPPTENYLEFDKIPSRLFGNILRNYFENGNKELSSSDMYNYIYYKSITNDLLV